jgi:hypothetical protein
MKTLIKLPRSASPLLKKKLPPRRPVLAKFRATDRDTVDFPVPALPLSQKIGLVLGSKAHCWIDCSKSTRVFGRQTVLCSSLELKDAPAAITSRSN